MPFEPPVLGEQWHKYVSSHSGFLFQLVKITSMFLPPTTRDMIWDYSPTLQTCFNLSSFYDPGKFLSIRSSAVQKEFLLFLPPLL